MKERYMLIRILSIVAELKDNDELITEPCYQIVDKDYETPESAYNAKQKYRYPEHYIVVQYWC